MTKLCENIMDFLSLFFFGDKKAEKKEETQAIYTLSSVFPSETIMHEVKKHI